MFVVSFVSTGNQPESRESALFLVGTFVNLAFILKGDTVLTVLGKRQNFPVFHREM